MAHPLLYEANARQWLASLSAKYGKRIDLFSVPDEEMSAFKQSAFTHFWLMGVWPTGPKSRTQAVQHNDLRNAYDEALPNWTEADILGSPYAVEAYTADPMLGGEPGLAAFRKQLAGLGIKLILDFIPNHLGLDHSWVSTHPDRFVFHTEAFPDSFPLEHPAGSRYVAHGKDPFFAGWTDTIQVDYRSKATRRAMTDLLRSVAEKCDGVRCDMAMLPLNEVFHKTWAHVPFTGDPAEGEFWRDAITEVKTLYPSFLFLAEAYWGLEGKLCELGFDYAYDKKLYDLLVHDHYWDVQSHILGMGEQNNHRAHFLENHDEPRISGSLDADRHRASAVLVMGLPGMRFLHDGQFEGLRRFARVQLARRASEPADQLVSELYRQLLTAFSQSAAAKGDPTILEPKRAWPENPTSQCITVVQWQEEINPDTFDLVVVNLAPHRAQCRVSLKILGSLEKTWRLQDRIGTEHWIRDGREISGEGLYLDLAAKGAHLFSFTRQ